MEVTSPFDYLTGHFRQRMLDARGVPGQQDYLGLDQEEVGTHLRWAAVGRVIHASQPGTIVDLGCGTGAMYPFLKNKGYFEGFGSVHVTGCDMIQERGDVFVWHLNAAGMSAEFIVSPPGQAFKDLGVSHTDCMVAVGVVGYWGLHSLGRLGDLHTFMRLHAKHGAISIPVIYNPMKMGHGYLNRFDQEDVLEFIDPVDFEVLEREMVIAW